jgi:hypothetical protein
MENPDFLLSGFICASRRQNTLTYSPETRTRVGPSGFRLSAQSAKATIDPGPVNYSTDLSGKVFRRADEKHLRLPAGLDHEGITVQLGKPAPIVRSP